VVLDIFTREVLGWSLAKNLETSLVLNATSNALHKTPTTPINNVKIIFHSDRGSQYASKAYKDFLDAHQILPSMSRRGNCYDNAYVESFFSTLKKEHIYRHKIDCQEEMQAHLFKYIEVWYNRQRLHSSLGYQTPFQYGESHYSSKKVSGQKPHPLDSRVEQGAKDAKELAHPEVSNISY